MAARAGRRGHPVVRATDETASEHLGRHVPAQESFGVFAGPGLFGHLVLHQFDAPEVAGAANVADDRMSFRFKRLWRK